MHFVWLRVRNDLWRREKLFSLIESVCAISGFVPYRPNSILSLSGRGGGVAMGAVAEVRVNFSK